MAYLDAILNSELLSYITATVLITIAVWLFSGVYSCTACSNNLKADEDKAMTTKAWFKLLLATACAGCSAMLVYRNFTSAPPSKLPSFTDLRTPVVKTGGSGFDSDSEASDNFN
jgi:hypothetical protein